MCTPFCCEQVISTDLNRVVGDLLQQLLFWQERQKATAPLKLKKRLVSGLRSVSPSQVCWVQTKLYGLG